MSVTPPGGNGTPIFTGLVGYCCSNAGPVTRSAAQSATRRMADVIESLPLRCSFDLELRVAHDFAPLLHFDLDPRAEFLGLVDHRNEAKRHELFTHVRHRADLDDLSVQ